MTTDLGKHLVVTTALLTLLAAGLLAKAGESAQPAAKRAFVLYGIEPYSGQSFHSLAGDERDQFQMPMYRTAAVPKDAQPVVEIEQAIDEFEPGVLAIANVTDPPVTLEFKILPLVPRSDWRERDHAEPYAYYFDALGDRYPTKDSEPGLRALPMKNLRLATVAFMWVPGYGFEMPDALPPLGSNLITVPPGETRFVWITVDSRGLAPGEYGLDLEVRVTNYAGAHQREDACEARVARLKATVWPFVLPDTWTQAPPWVCTFDVNIGLSNDKWQENFHEHGVNSWMIELSLPPPMNPDGTLSQPAEFRAMGGWRCNLPELPLAEYLERANRSKGILLIATHSFRPGYKNPWKRTDGQVEPIMSPIWQKAYASYVRQFASYMKAHGVDYDRWWWYPYDENLGELALSVAKLTHEIDPNVKFFVNMISGDKEYLAKWLPYVGIWCVHHQWPRKDGWGKDAGPNGSGYGHPMGNVGSPAEAFKVLRSLAQVPIVCYTCGSDVRRFHPFFFWRLLPWEAQAENLPGFIYWAPTWHGGDGWGRGKWYYEFIDVVYRDHTGDPINTVRWEGFRDGVDDYLYMDLIRQAAAKLPADSPTRQAAEKLLESPLRHIPQLVHNVEELKAFREYRRKLAQTVVDLGAGRKESER